MMYYKNMFTGIDFITVILVLSGILTGTVRGFLGSIVDLIGISGGIALSSIVYRAPVNLFRRFNITGSVVELICFLFTSLFLILTIILLLELLRKRADWKHFLDRVFGFFLGIIEGMFFAGIIFITMSGSYNAAMELQQSKLPKYIIKYIPKIYEHADKIGITIPKMLYIPHSYEEEFNPESKTIQFLRINFYRQYKKLTCIKCGGEVKFEGYFPKVGAAMIPKFVCTKCGRTSDGCQTYELFHLYYKQCPIDLARKGIRFDCPRFPNHEWITPKGPCPVDGKELELWKWEPPAKY